MQVLSFDEVDLVSGGHGHGHGHDSVDIGNGNSGSFNTGGVRIGPHSTVTLGDGSQIGSNGGLNLTNSTF